MSSSGLIYAVIVGAWAAYLVPMWLRRQDELNEARPTERFSTAIRLLAGRSGLERRAARALGDEPRDDEHSSDGPPGRDGAASGDPAADSAPPAVEPESSPSGEPPPAPVPEPSPASSPSPSPSPSPERGARGERPGSAPHGGAQRRARLLARRRRMVTALFLAFALGAVVAAVAGLAFLWVPAVPAILLTLYIGHLRKLERQRYEVKLDRARAAQAAERLRKREQQRAEARSVPAEAVDTQAHTQVHTQPHVRAHAPARAQAPAAEGRAGRRPHLRLAADPGEAAVSAPSASAVAEATEHEEWVDGMRERGAAGPDSWEPVPVPLPTYVTAPVAPRVSRGLDLTAPGTWTAGRPAESARNTPLFDQYAEPSAPEARPRAANE
ncbi:gephyrin-like molybdotransferase receptor GlpR [Kitasatospora sp. NBC_01300]|uniref:divisome protein SepX/GlpR n=1 Tax=Kitasatospora sp. NBC_01300 TaxID=2903574 RepID=UPI00352EB023|nr:hypothetical protein OG556_14460 [Kitasatospora sp. NBC_01300]